MKKKIGIGILLFLVLAYLLPGYAADRVIRNHSFDLTDIDELSINNSVGLIELYLVEGDELRVEVEIEGEDQGIFRGDRDVDDVDLEVRQRNGRLTLTLDEDDVSANWVVELPAVSIIDIDMDVGKIEAEIGDSILDINLGVGEVDVEAPLAMVGRISGSARVGEVTIHGADEIDRRRTFVSAQTEGRGEGENRIDIDVGVGDVRVELH